MDTIMRSLAAKSAVGFIIRLIVLVTLVSGANIVFAFIVDDRELHSPIYYFAHAIFVGGPLIAFFLAVTVFQMRLQRKLWQLSCKDGLTGLNNRGTFLNLAEELRVKSKGGILLMLDADLFKTINDTYGHQAGDACLRSIARALRCNVRQSDVIGRIGGEEFAIYLSDTTLSQARIIGERLIKPIPFDAGPDQKYASVTMSIGAVQSSPQATLEEMFGLADNALYQAKRQGRARMVWTDGHEVRSNMAAG